jgi:hypothetical protein
MDAPTVVTLKNPEMHSLHCLLDIPACYESPFHILEDPPCPGDLYGTGWAAADNTRLLEAARSEGICDTCGDSGTLEKGFRGEVRGIVITTNPPVINVTEFLYLPVGQEGCTDVTLPVPVCSGGENATDSNATKPPSTTTTPPKSSAATTGFSIMMVPVFAWLSVAFFL